MQRKDRLEGPDPQSEFQIKTHDSELCLTSVHEPFPHRLSHVEGDPLGRAFGQHVLGCDVALFPDVFVGPHNL